MVSVTKWGRKRKEKKIEKELRKIKYIEEK